ncbi:MAG TPA: cupredoxin domain-containing protein [Burkholderiales bacterium]|nr:cupredoxin domain-containing protein [Burkholderiales bacterium]
MTVRRMPISGLLAFLVTCSLFTSKVSASQLLEIKNQQFSPMKLTLPQNKKVKITLKNNDNLPAEFESTDLSREILVPGHSQVSIYVGPLDPGNYKFFNDFNQAATGLITVPSSTGAN